MKRKALTFFGILLGVLLLASTDLAHAQTSCVGFPNGVPCDDRDPCTQVSTCQGGVCVGIIPFPNGFPCDDGLFCNGGDACQNGICVSSGNDPCVGPDGDFDCSESCDETTDACTAPDPDGNGCDDGQSCTAIEQCLGGTCTPFINVDNGTPCEQDGTFCNGVEECQSGSCITPGDPCDGPDGDGDCRETCNEGTDSCTGPDPNGSVCDFVVPCFAAECDNGDCFPTGESLDDGTPCPDGNFCNGDNEQCFGFNCISLGNNPCDGPDGDADCSESCDEASDTCTLPDPNGGACESDGAFCTGVEECQSGTCTSPGDPCPGPDGDANCLESCDEAGDTCSLSDPDGSTCDDGLICTVNDSCAAGACTDHVDASDGTPCESDGAFCTGVEECQSGACASPGDPCSGSDNDTDCSESCHEMSDSCSAPDPPGTMWGVSLTLARSVLPGDLDLFWGATCDSAGDYAIYEGVLGDFTSHVPAGVSGCTTGGATMTTLTPIAGNRYFVVVPQDPPSGIEGTYGFSSDGTPRTQSFSACQVQATCDCREKTVFVTSTTSNGNLGGLAGADATCQSLAEAANLAGTYKAWLSDNTTDVRDRFTQSTVPYARTDGQVIADDWADLVDNPSTDPLLVPIDRDENGTSVGTVNVWTGSTFAGQMLAGDTVCSDWVDGTNTSNGRTGRTNRTDLGWTSRLTVGCSNSRALYCFQQ